MTQRRQLSIKRCPELSMERCMVFHVVGDKDRITNLDENLVSEILSRLPTRDVVRTSILSKGWRYKWTTSYNMAVKVNHKLTTNIGLFAKFMDRMLKYSQALESFRLRVKLPCSSKLQQAWISSALTHRLEVLDLKCNVSGIVIPCSLLNRTCLKELNLHLCYSTLDVAAMNCAPKLTSLYIVGMNIVNTNHSTSTTVKFDFPLLETFTLDAFKWLNVKSVELHAPSLTTFSSAPRDSCLDYDYSVLIFAPKLATFGCRSRFPENFILDGSSIVSAKLICCGYRLVDNLKLLTKIGIRVRNLLNELKNLEELCVSSFTAEVSRLGLQRHDKLRRLTFTYLKFSAEQLLGFLHAAPSLKILTLNVKDWVDYDYEAMEAVPYCIVSHLEEVELLYFKCQKPQYNLLKFLSINGEKLHKLKMADLPVEKQAEVKEFVSEFRNVEFVF